MTKFQIILPVRNGGEYLRLCVGSILNQTYRDFSLLVLDNCSTDGTTEWLLELTDPRITVISSSRMLTIEENWGRILGLQKLEFITLIGHDDLLKEHYLEVMNTLIIKHPDASLYQAHFSYIDANGALIRNSQAMNESETAQEFLSKYLDRKIDVMGTGFMMRSSDYNKLGGIAPYPNLLFADFELWIRLTKKGYKATAQENCFSFRIHHSTTTSSPDTKFLQAFERFIRFLSEQSVESLDYKSILNEKASGYLMYYCQGFSHRLLRTPMKKRNGITVKKIVSSFIEYANLLGVLEDFDPTKNVSIQLALLIDSNKVTRAMFRTLKKVYSKPILK